MRSGSHSTEGVAGSGLLLVTPTLSGAGKVSTVIENPQRDVTGQRFDSARLHDENGHLLSW